MKLSHRSAKLLQNAFNRLTLRSIPVPWTGCRLWLGAVDKWGYSVVSVGGQSYLGHRVMYLATRGYLDESLVVRHMCDVPLCVEPSHLALGTRADNQRDMARHGRGTRSKMGRPFGARLHSKGGRTRWEASVKVGGVDVSLGCFETSTEATRVASEFKAALLFKKTAQRVPVPNSQPCTELHGATSNTKRLVLPDATTNCVAQAARSGAEHTKEGHNDPSFNH